MSNYCPSCGRAVGHDDQPMAQEGDGRDVILTLIQELKSPLSFLSRMLWSRKRPIDRILFHLVCAAKIATKMTKKDLFAEMEARRALGIKRYKTPLQPFNGRVSPLDMFQEILDSLHYAYQAKMEGK